ncbi:hypothetical protein UVI_02006380 [Ustilaginoidea virens]|uniref:Uncharacterized protein n=1 Tax=Ustilaginoidea virens TaxID=1159556 RepID=A0A1B5L2S1_USTVR|nr:hypothetical protein UVI_02006380 [Ustilaginoidea virens]
MTGPASAPRYSAEDFETSSIRSAAPSYGEIPQAQLIEADLSDVPSYHTLPYNQNEVIPPYSPPPPRTATLVSSASPPLFAPGRQRSSTALHHSVGLPPLPPVASPNTMSIHNFHLPTWSANNGPAARHYRNVAERRITSGRYAASPEPMARPNATERASEQPDDDTEMRPLEDPFLVGEVAAAQARQERLLREGDDILVREDRQWDWLLGR